MTELSIDLEFLDKERMRAGSHFEATLPPEIAAAQEADLIAKSRGGNFLIVGTDGNAMEQLFTNERGTFNVARLLAHIKKFPDAYGPIDFPIVDQYVTTLRERYDVDPRYADLDPQPGDDEPIVICFEDDGQWLVDGSHRFCRLAKAGRKTIKTWVVTLPLIMRFRVHLFADGRRFDDTTEQIKETYGVYADRDGSVHVDAGKSTPDKERFAASMSKVLENRRD